MCLFVYFFDCLWPLNGINTDLYFFHSFVYLVFHFRHTTKNQRGSQPKQSVRQLWQSVSEFCSGLLKYPHEIELKSEFLHLPGTKWCGPHPDNGSVEVLHWHLSQFNGPCYKSGHFVAIRSKLKLKRRSVSMLYLEELHTHSEKKRSPMHDSKNH